MVDARLDIAALIKANEAEHIVVPVVAAGVGVDPSLAAKAIRAGAKEYISLPPVCPWSPEPMVPCRPEPTTGRWRQSRTGSATRC